MTPNLLNVSDFKNYRFGIYTSFYNAESFIDQIFDSVSKLKYDNFKWIVTDDFSSDNTKHKLLKKCNSCEFVKYIEQDHKKEMYWQPNKFFDESFDYVVLIDCDDDFDYNFLSIYNYFANLYPDAVLLTSDYIKKNNDDIHSFSLVKNDDLLIKKLARYYPNIDYVNNLSYNALGVLRCFKNLKNLSFPVTDFDACGEDVYRTMILNSIGKWFHIPRTLYEWKMRKDSESHSLAKSNFNGNFELGLGQLKTNCYDPYYDYDEIYEITNSFSVVGINNLSGKKISIFSHHLNPDAKNKLRSLYFDCTLFFNEVNESDYYFICGRSYLSSDFYFDFNNRFAVNLSPVGPIKSKISEIKSFSNNKIVIYFLADLFFSSPENMNNYANLNLEKIKNELAGFNYWYFSFFRHTYFIL